MILVVPAAVGVPEIVRVAVSNDKTSGQVVRDAVRQVAIARSFRQHRTASNAVAAYTFYGRVRRGDIVFGEDRCGLSSGSAGNRFSAGIFQRDLRAIIHGDIIFNYQGADR